jgi:regulator of sigma D
MKAVYANETDYFVAHRNNLKYCAKVVSYLDDIFAHSPITIEWLQSRDELIQLYLCVMLLGEYYCEASPTLCSNEVLAFFCSHRFDSIEHDYLHYYSAIIHLSLANIDKAARI